VPTVALPPAGGAGGPQPAAVGARHQPGG